MKRYHVLYGLNFIEKSKTGEYVRYEDAADLQRQLAEVTRERDTLKAMLDLQNLRAERANLGSGK